MRLHLLAVALLLSASAEAQVIAFKKGCPPSAAPPAACSTAASVDGTCYSDTDFSPAKVYFCDGPTTSWTEVGAKGGNAPTASALDHDPADCTLPEVAVGISATGAAACAQPSNVTGNAATATLAAGATALAADPTDCLSPNFARGINASGTAQCAQPSDVTGNAATATLATAASALAADPADCTLPNVALGIGASGAATCAQPSSVTGNAATATALAANPSACTANSYVTDIDANGTLTCSQPSASNLSNGVSGTGAVVLATGNAGTATALAADPADCSSNQFANAINASGTLSCSALTLAGAQFANQGTTTTVLHGNASGNPSFATVGSSDLAASLSLTTPNIGVASGTSVTLTSASTIYNGADGAAVFSVGKDSTHAVTFGYNTQPFIGSSTTNVRLADAIGLWPWNDNNADLGTGSARWRTGYFLTSVRVDSALLTLGTMAAEKTAELRTPTHSYTWTNAQVAALPTTAGDILAVTLPAKTVVVNMYIVITGQAAGPTTVTVACGRTGTTYIDYIVASDAKAAANTVYGDVAGERGTNLTGYDLPSYTGTTAVNCHFVSSGGNLSTVTGSTGRVVLTTTLVP